MAPAAGDRQLVADLGGVVGESGLLQATAELVPYECDAYTLERAVPDLVVLPRSTTEAGRVLRILAAHDRPLVPRGAGTSLAGGTLATGGAVVVGTARMRRILELDPEGRLARVEAGVVNLELSRAARPHGLHYAPDPSSQSVCTLGGNVATNSGGPHTLKYGVTTNHVLGLTLVLPDGRVLKVGGDTATAGLDLTGLVVGHEGTFGLVTEATVRLMPLPAAVRTCLAVFESVAAASAAISAVIGAGLIPAALEMMDRDIVGAVEDAYGLGLPRDAGALLLIELDGAALQVEGELERLTTILAGHAVRELRIAATEAERQALWTARKRAFGAIGRLAPNYCTQDGVVPRTQIPAMLERIQAIARRYDLRIPNVFHAGDGNMHPILLYDDQDAAQVRAVLAASTDILAACLELGGSVTGEHGVGVEKVSMLSQMFGDDDLECMRRVRRVFDPAERANPGKIFPAGGACHEPRRPRPAAPA